MSEKCSSTRNALTVRPLTAGRGAVTSIRSTFHRLAATVTGACYGCGNRSVVSVVAQSAQIRARADRQAFVGRQDDELAALDALDRLDAPPLAAAPYVRQFVAADRVALGCALLADRLASLPPRRTAVATMPDERTHHRHIVGDLGRAHRTETCSHSRNVTPRGTHLGEARR